MSLHKLDDKSLRELRDSTIKYLAENPIINESDEVFTLEMTKLDRTGDKLRTYTLSSEEHTYKGISLNHINNEIKKRFIIKGKVK